MTEEEMDSIIEVHNRATAHLQPKNLVIIVTHVTGDTEEKIVPINKAGYELISSLCTDLRSARVQVYIEGAEEPFINWIPNVKDRS